MMHRNKEINSLLTIGQFVASILVIMIHCGRLFDNQIVHFMFKSVICRSAVPLFMVSSAYFYRRKTRSDVQYRNIFFRKQVKTYLLWSLAYLPLAYDYLISSFNIDSYLYPLAALVGLGYTGTYYHLWYLPALFIALLITEKSVNKYGYRICVPIGLLLFSLGAIETYSGWLNGTVIYDIFKSYQTIFLTTRNGLFMGVPYVLIGFLSSELHSKIIHVSKAKRVIAHISSFSLLALESSIIFLNQGDDKNFMFMMLPCSFLLFNDMLNNRELKSISRLNLNALKGLSRYYFFLHPAVIWGWQVFQDAHGINISRFDRFIIILFLTHIASVVLIKLAYVVRSRTILNRVPRMMNIERSTV